MSDIKLDIGFHDYEHVRALIDGTVKIDGVEPTFHTARIVSDIFERMVAHHEFGVSELGWPFYLRTLDLEDPPFIAIPVFLARQFRHSAIFVNPSKGIESPRDLAGKTVGEFATYDHDVEVFGEDWWPHGLGANRITVDAFLRWHHEQGPSRRRMTCGEVFASELLHT